MSDTHCTCPRIDGYRIRKTSCPVHGAEDLALRQAKEAETQQEAANEMAAAWSDYRKDYGVDAGCLSAAHKAFKAGWTAARQGDQSGVLR